MSSGEPLRALVLFSGSGGMSEGYRRAGFEVVDVDLDPRLRNPHGYWHADAMALAAEPWLLDAFDLVHGSPPCQRWAAGARARENHPDLIAPLRELLLDWGGPYVIENVAGAPLRFPAVVCAGALGCVVGDMQLHRHRYFESSLPLMGHPCYQYAPHTISVVGQGTQSANRRQHDRVPTLAELRELMGVDWPVPRAALSQMIPPPVGEWIGAQAHHLIAGARTTTQEVSA